MKKIINFIIFTCLFGLFFACNDITNQSAKTTQKEKAYIKFSNVSRNAFNPASVNEDDIVKAELTVQNTTTGEEVPYPFYPETEEKTVKTDSGEVTVTEVVKNAIDLLKGSVLAVDEGNYIFFLDLYVNNLEDAETIVLSAKTEEMEIEENKTYTINFFAKYLENGSGDLSITYKWHGNEGKNPVSRVEMNLISLDGSELESYPVEECEVLFDETTEFGSATYKKIAVPNGEYFLKVSLYDNPPKDSGIEETLLNTYQDYVRIYGFKTIDTRTLSLNECNQHFYITYETNGGELNGTYTSTFNPKKSDKLPGSINFVTQNFGTSTNRWIFAGWYMLNDDGTEEKLESTPLDVNEDITLYAKWDLPYTYYSLMESNENDGQYYALDSGTNSYLEFNSIIESSEFEPFVAQIIAKHKEADEEKLGEGFVEVENGEYFSMNGILSVNKKYDRKAVKNTYICTADDEHTQTIEKEGKYGCEIDFSSDDIPVYPGFEFEKWQNKDGEDVESLPLLYDTVDSEFHAVYKDVRSTSSGDIIVNDGLLNISIEEPETLYMNNAPVELKAQTKLDNTDLSLSNDVSWRVQLLYGGVDINAYGTEYYELLQTDVTIDAGNGGTNATTGKKSSVVLKNRLEIGGVYQLYVAATYKTVTSSAIFNLNIQNYEYYEHSVSESDISTVLNSEMKELIAPAIVVLKGNIPADNTSLYGNICTALKEASEKIEVDMSQVSGITAMGTGSNYDFEGLIGSLILPPSVTTIREKAFDLSRLNKITIPASVTEIDAKAFNKCNSLNQFIIAGEVEGQTPVYSTIKDGVMLIQNVFDDSGELESCILLAGAKDAVPENLDFSDSDLRVITKIGPYAFQGNLRLKSIESFGNVTIIGDSAFSSCSSLTSIPEIKAPIASVGYQAFYSCDELQTFCLGSDSITIGKAEVGENTYSSVNAKELIFNFDIICYEDQAAGITANYDKVKNTIVPRIQNVESVVFKGKVQLPDLDYSTPPSSIPSDSFLYEYRYRLKSITFDDQKNGALSEVGAYQFNHYTYLETVTNNGKLDSIGDRAFADTKISQINLDGITWIGQNAFGNCSNLSEVSIDENSGSRYKTAMNGASIIMKYDDKNTPEDLTDDRLERLVLCLPASGITTLNFSSGELSEIKEIGAYAFDGCTALTEITSWGGLKVIDKYAFNACSNLASIPVLGKVPENETERLEMNFYENAFKGCNNLNEIKIGGTSVWLHNTFEQSSAYNVIFDFVINEDNVQDVTRYIVEGLYPYISKVTFNETVNLPDVSFHDVYLDDDGNGNVVEGEALYDDDNNLIEPPTVAIMKHSSALFARFVDTATFGTVIFNGEGSTIGAYQFCNFEYKLGETTNYYGAEYVQLKGNVTTIGKYAFYNCKKLDAIDLTGVEVIYDYAFANTGLTAVSIPESIFAIGSCAFMGIKENSTLSFAEPEDPTEALNYWRGFYKCTRRDAWTQQINNKYSDPDAYDLITPTFGTVYEYFGDAGGIPDYIKENIMPASEPPSAVYFIYQEYVGD